ncbi:MAG: peptidase domain-containing ABC transporter [Bacteroidales bacterium]|nr:peptidase domain-containing ABC transporter [Bacteroidales bacterium]
MGYVKLAGIRQNDITDCAAACIAAIAGWYGLHLPLITIREMCGSGRQGTTIKGVVDGCEAIGMEAVAMKSPEKNLDDLRLADTPSILHLTKETGLHFVVLCGSDRKGFVIMDPAIGRRTTLSDSEMEQLWSGFIVFVTPSSSFRQGKKTKSLASHLFPLILRHKLELATSLILSILYIIIGISVSVFLERIIDVVIPSKDYDKIVSVTAAMGVLFLLSLIIGYSRIKNTLSAGIGIDNSLIGGYIRHLFELPVSFFSLRGSGELNSRISDAMNIRDFIINGTVSVVMSVLTLIVSFLLMFTYYWKLALFMLMFLPVYVVIYVIANKVNKRLNREIIESSALFEEQTVEGISSVSTIKYNGCEEKMAGIIRSRYIKFATSLYKGARYNSLFSLGTDGVSKGITLFLLTVGAVFIFKGDLSVGELVSFYSITAFFSTPLSELVGISNTYNEAKISAQRLFEIMDYEGEEYGGHSIGVAPLISIHLDKVCFGYPGSLPLFKDLDVEIRGGEITAITGKSGCGKSTVAALLMRGYKPNKGSITLDGVDINRFNLGEWRKYVAIVPQDPVLMNASILDNITGWSKEPDLTLVATLLTELGMSDFVQSLPGGLVTKIGERGALLSGGQRQRIALARALYHKPRILILDEATSSLDSESEGYILSKLSDLKNQGITIIMITHKKDNAAIADKVINIGAHQEGETCTP